MAALTASPGWTRTACALPLMSWAQVSCHRPGDTAQRCSAHTTEPPSRLLDAKGRCWGCCPSLGQAGKGSCGAQPASLGLLLDVPTSRRGGERRGGSCSILAASPGLVQNARGFTNSLVFPLFITPKTWLLRPFSCLSTGALLFPCLSGSYSSFPSLGLHKLFGLS